MGVAELTIGLGVIRSEDGIGDRRVEPDPRGSERFDPDHFGVSGSARISGNGGPVRLESVDIELRGGEINPLLIGHCLRDYEGIEVALGKSVERQLVKERSRKAEVRN
jgi:hypothetical protein